MGEWAGVIGWLEQKPCLIGFVAKRLAIGAGWRRSRVQYDNGDRMDYEAEMRVNLITNKHS